MSQSVILTDSHNRTQVEMPVIDGAIPAKSLQKLRVTQDGTGLVSYDPGYQNTAPAISSITMIDGMAGKLLYRGYPIEVLAVESNYLEVAFLLNNGELPSTAAAARWREEIQAHATVDPFIVDLIRSFPRDAHPMGILISALGAMGTLYPEAKKVLDSDVRRRQVYRLLGQLPVVAAHIYCHGQGIEADEPKADDGYIGNFLRMVRNFGLETAEEVPAIRAAMNCLFILHADHEQNCSTTAMRSIGSSHADPYSSMAGAVAALYGPLHGGANEAVLRMLEEIGSADHVEDFLQRVINREALLMGFGHRVYKNMDPRATLIKTLAYSVFEVTGANPKIDLALALEQTALGMEYFQARRLYPNVDFYSGIIYQALGIPADYYTVLFGIARAAGWLAHWQEQLEDPAQKIARPKQIYRGPDERAFVPLEQR